jgi:hypothetical protein
MLKTTAYKIGWTFLAILLLGVYTNPLLAQQPEQEAEMTSVAVIDDSGKFVIGLYYGGWTLNILKSAFEEALSDELGEQIREEIIDEIKQLNPFIQPTDFTNEFSFDSSGPSYGLELRYYPQGRFGAFSLGLSVDKLGMKISGVGNVRQNFDDNTYAEADGTGEVILNPVFTTLSFRWDFMPRWRVSPYYSMGLGLAVIGKEKMSGDAINYDKTDSLSWEYEGVYNWVAGRYNVAGADQMSLKEAEEQGDFNVPNILPLLLVNLGVRADILPYLVLRGEVGFYDGIAFRLGVSGRF